MIELSFYLSILCEHSFSICTSFIHELLCESLIGKSEDLGREKCRVARAVDSNGCYGDSRGHLYCGEEGVKTVEISGFARDTDYG